MESDSTLRIDASKHQSLSQVLESSGRILALAKPETLEQLNVPNLKKLFHSQRLLRPEFESNKCVASQLKDWCEINQPDYLLAVGGDGTLNLACQAAIEHDLKMILVPAGTANDFAGGLPESEIDLLLWNPVDVIALDSPQLDKSTGFVNMMALGCGARHSTDVDTETKATWGSLAYLIQAWQVLGDLEGFGLDLICDEHAHQFEEVVQLFVANGRTCGGGYCVVDSARFDDGMMDIVVIQQGTALQIASFIQSYMVGTHLEHELCCHIRCRRAELKLDRIEAMTLDGEPSELQQCQLRVLPGRLPMSKLSSANWMN